MGGTTGNGRVRRPSPTQRLPSVLLPARDTTSTTTTSMSELLSRRRVVGSVFLLGVVVTVLLGVQLQAVHRILLTTGTTKVVGGERQQLPPPPPPPLPEEQPPALGLPGGKRVRQRTTSHRQQQQQPPPPQPQQEGQSPQPPALPLPLPLPLPPPTPRQDRLDDDEAAAHDETARPSRSPEEADRPPALEATTTAATTTTAGAVIIVLPHVFDRRTSSTSLTSTSTSSQAESRWEPSLTGLRDLNDVDEQFFYDTSWKGTTKATNATTTNASDATPPSNAPRHRPIDPTLPHREFLGFIRITKTASSSIVRFLQRARNVHAGNNFVNFDELYRVHQSGGGPTVSGHPQAPPCFFSRHTNMSWTPPPKSMGPWNCHHFAYSHLVMNWAKSLQYLNDQFIEAPKLGSAVDLLSSTSSSPPLQIKFRIFTIVRDPYDRMVSYYHFWRKIYPDWLASTPPKLLTRLMAGDLPGWMEHRANTSVPNLDAAHQYLYLSQDVNRAIRLVTAFTPVSPPATSTQHEDATTTTTTTNSQPPQQQVIRIVPLVSECFDASVTLLVELFPNVLERGSEREFLASSGKKFNERIEPKPELGMAPVAEYNSTYLRERSLEWFPDEYRFYDAAVRQFRKLLAASSTIDPSVVHSCLQVLDEREASRRPARAPESSKSFPAAAST